MDTLKFVLFVALAGLFIVLILWMVGGCNCSSGNCPTIVDPIDSVKETIDPPPKFDKNHLDNEDVAQRSYFEMTDSLFDLIDGKDTKDVQVNITANISLFSDTLCANCDSDESKALQMRYIVAIQTLLDIQDKDLSLNNHRYRSNLCSRDSEDLTSQDLSPTPSGSYSGSSSQELMAAKKDIAEISKSLARSYSKCLHLNDDNLRDFFVASAAYISSYKKYARTQPEKAANIRKAHNLLTSRLHISKIDKLNRSNQNN